MANPSDFPKDDAPTAANGTGRRKAQHSNSSSEQSKRILRALSDGPITTLFARRELDVMHPGGRIMELRRDGHLIDTVWTEATTDCGKVHRVALYVLRHGAANDANTLADATEPEAAQSVA